MAPCLEEPPADVSKQQEFCETYEDGLPTDVVPGTEIMTDVGSHRYIKSERRHNVLIPQPSKDAHDPLVRPHLFQGSKYTYMGYVVTSVELEPMVEVLDDHVCDLGFVLSGFGPNSTCTHYSPTGERLSLGSVWCHTFHRCHDFDISI